MDIVIIGSGNAAAVLGRKFKAARHNILQIVSRNASSASNLAYEFDTESTNYWSLINRSADIYIIAVSDDAISEVAANVQLPGKVVAHTAGTVSKHALKGVSQHYGVFYPLQSLKKDLPNDPEVPIFIDGSDQLTIDKLTQLARSISPNLVARSEDDHRSRLHVAAVIVGNFSNYLYALAEDYCKKEHLDFQSLYPLILETAQRIRTNSPSEVQTGPAMRHDKETIEKHLHILERHAELKKVYQFLSDSIWRGVGS